MNPVNCRSVDVVSAAIPLQPEWLRTSGLRGLHCGCGQNWREGWLNTDHVAFRAVSADGSVALTQPDRLARLDRRFDYLQHDAIERYPIEDGAFEWVYAEHFIEHLSPESAVAWLRETRRVLRPGGQIRLSTPDLRRYMSGYLQPDGHFFAEHRARLSQMGMENVPQRRAWMVNQIFRMWGHQWIYDVDEIRHVARLAGFSAESITECRFQEGREPSVWQLDRPVRSDESLYVEISR